MQNIFFPTNMKTWTKTLLISIMTLPAFAQSGFKAQQLKFDRVKTAYDEKWSGLQKELKAEKFPENFSLFLAAYKTEGKLEVWLKAADQDEYKLFKTYNFCAHSGTLGPKIKEGDLQTPEGYYVINAFNPQSNFHLSLGINYPNKIDLLRSASQRPGGDIYIHGNCVTVGCIPLTDDKIKELYPIAVEAKNNGQQQIQVYIFPFKMTVANVTKYTKQFPQQEVFWRNLKSGYDYFEKHKTLPLVTQKGTQYAFK